MTLKSYSTNKLMRFSNERMDDDSCYYETSCFWTEIAVFLCVSLILF